MSLLSDTCYQYLKCCLNLLFPLMACFDSETAIVFSSGHHGFRVENVWVIMIWTPVFWGQQNLQGCRSATKKAVNVMNEDSRKRLFFQWLTLKPDSVEWRPNKTKGQTNVTIFFCKILRNKWYNAKGFIWMVSHRISFSLHYRHTFLPCERVSVFGSRQ